MLARPDWQAAAERTIHWALGHNLEGLSLHSGIGYRHPTPFSAYVAQIPDAFCVGQEETPAGWFEGKGTRRPVPS